MDMQLRTEELTHESFQILLAEDDMTQFMWLSKRLRDRGHAVKVVGNGKELLVALDNKTYDIVFTDIVMPKMSGLEAAETIRKEPKWTDLPIIAISAACMKELAEKDEATGISRFLAKPIDLHELDDVLDQCSKVSHEIN